MVRKLMRALLMGALGLSAGSSVVGCAQERAPINQVQADALAKSFFVGPNLENAQTSPEFYMRGTVIDVGYGAAQDGLFTSTYAQPVARIRWEITENYLNARLSYEQIANSDGKGNLNDGLIQKTTNDGQVVASYKIQSHFDIRRAYNPTTGEELNIVVENSTDRPWYQREYFRIDWSQNLASDAYGFDTLSSLGWIGGIEYEPLAFTVLDPNDPNAPHFDATTGYFDVTVKAFAKPALIDLSSLGWGINQIPACELPGEFAGGTQPYGNCNPVEITLRYSFKKVVDKDYEPVNYDGFRFQAFGIFTTERMGYAQDYGISDALWYRFADRYNIWNRSHYYSDPTDMTGSVPCATFATTEAPTGDPNADPNRSTLSPGTADECAAVTTATGKPGSQCDVFNKKCTLPYAARTPVTIPWYINGLTTDTVESLQAQIAATTDPTQIKNLQASLASTIQQGEDLFEATNWAVQEWDLALKTAVQTSRYTECKRTGGTAADCAAQFPMWTGQQEDNDEAVLMSRDLDLCRRNASLGNAAAAAPYPFPPGPGQDSDALEAQRTNGWGSATCTANVTSAAAALNAARGGKDVSAQAMAQVINQPPMIVLCHNPVVQSDNPACGALGLAPRLGDIRYNTVLNINKPQTPSAWGIMVDGDDPLTGEKVAASINIWTAVTDIAAQSLVDLVRYANGELTTEDITNGTYIDNWAMAAQLGNSGQSQTMPKRAIHQRLAAVSGVTTDKFEAMSAAGMPAALKPTLQAFHDQNVNDIAISQAVASPVAAVVQSRFQAMHNSTTEATLLNQAMLQRAGITGAIPQGSVADQASGVALNNPKVASDIQSMREMAMSAQGYCLLEDAPEMSSLTGIADAMKRKFPRNAQVCTAATDCSSNTCTSGHCVETPEETADRYNAMVRYVTRRYHYAVLAHEMGHSIGLRHNFVSSYAALHFRPQYWQLRTSNGKMTTPCTDAVTDGSTCTGPRYWDPMTEEEQEQMIWMFMQSTVMDYPGDVSQDTLGLGSYDFAAARMFYGDVTSVYQDPSFASNKPNGQGILAVTDNFGGLVGIKYQVGNGNTVTNLHYSQLQASYNLIQNCQSVTPTAPDWWRADVDGVWDQVFDGKIVSVGGQASKCRSQQVDYLGWNDLRLPTDAEVGAPAGSTLTNFYRGGNAIEITKGNGAGRTRVPYSFASDNWADTGNTSVFRHDNGADPYEQLMFLTTTQENRHILDNWRRGRSTFNVRSASDRSYQRYNEKMLDIAGGLGFLGNIYKDLLAGQGYAFEEIWPLVLQQNYSDNVIGATVAFDHFARELSRPESGQHYFMAHVNPSMAGLPLGMQDPTLQSQNNADSYGSNPQTGATVVDLVMPEGSTGYLGIEMQPGVVGSIGFGGHLLENSLPESEGDYDVDYTWNCGSYYDKINTAILFSLSEDRFISQSRQDFYDARFRAVGLQDLFPDGFRRIIGNALTGDRQTLAPHVTADASGVPLLQNKADPYDPSNKDALKYPAQPVGWTSWWPTEGPIQCFPLNGSQVCSAYDGAGGGFNPQTIANTVPVDPQIGWEVQKFIIAWTLAYSHPGSTAVVSLPAQQTAGWLDMMRIYRLGQNQNPIFSNYVQWQDPVSQETYYAASYGKECLFGPSTATDEASCVGPDPINAPTGAKWVEKGIAGRVLEYANWLSSQGYAADPAFKATNGFDTNGQFHAARQMDGTPVIRTDPTMASVQNGFIVLTPPPTCDLDIPANMSDCNGNESNPLAADYCGATSLRASGCTTPLTTGDNHWASQLAAFKSVPDYLWEVMMRYGLGTPDQLGVFPN